jgi:hypothetical protein
MANILRMLVMTLREFTNLGIKHQSDGVFEIATIVAGRNDDKYFYVLYQLYSFYIERKYDIESGKLINIWGFESDCKTLDLYVNEIDLKCLVE